MPVSGLRARALLFSCAYVFVVVALVSVAVTATLALSPSHKDPLSKVTVAPVSKIGPGYARMQPIYEGKPDKVLYTTPYYIPVRAHFVVSKRPAPLRSIEAVIAPPAIPVHMAVAQPSYSAPDFHRIY